MTSADGMSHQFSKVNFYAKQSHCFILFWCVWRFSMASFANNFYCEVCDRSFSSELYYTSHMNGRPHREVLQQKESASNPSNTSCIVLWYCGSCDKTNKLFRDYQQNGDVHVTAYFCRKCDKINKRVAQVLV